MARLTLRDWADERFGGDLDGQLIRWRTEGLTIDQIVRRLEDHNLPVSRETVRRWSLDAEKVAS